VNCPGPSSSLVVCINTTWPKPLRCTIANCFLQGPPTGDRLLDQYDAIVPFIFIFWRVPTFCWSKVYRK
jgi:hypothetical protein